MGALVQSRSVRRRERLGFIRYLLPALVITTLRADPQETPPVEIRFEGARRTSRAFLHSIVRMRDGDAFSREAVDADVVRLLRTGRFLGVTGDVEHGDDRVIVTYRIRERLLIREVRVEGNVSIKTDTLLERIPARVGDPVDSFAVREGRDAVEAVYREKGFGYASVTVDMELARRTGDVVYRIEEGPRVRVRKVRYEGNASFSERELNKHIRTRRALWIIRPGTFDDEQVTADATALQRFYRGEGFLDARVSFRVDPGVRQGDLRVVFTISEGRRYEIETLRVEGNRAVTSEDIRLMLQSQPGRVMRQPALDADVRAVRTLYGERGYIYSTVRAVRVFSTEPGRVVVTLRIEEGEKFSVGRIVVRGNATTQDKVVRRALDLFPGDTFNLTLARDAEKKLRQTQIFDRATVTPVGNLPGVRDIVVDVSETDDRTQFIFGFGVTSNSGLGGFISVNYSNFDLFDTPRSLSELIKGRAFRGAGQRLRLELRPGTELNRFRIDFTEPYLFDRPVRFDTSLYHFTRSRENHDERRSGATVSFGRRLVDGIGARDWFKDWYGELSFRIEQVDLQDVDIFNHRSIREVEDGNILTSAKVTLVRDRTDNRFVPTSGDRMLISYEQFAGDFTFGKLRLGYAKHYTVDVDEQNRKSVLSMRVDAGFIAGEAPVYEKFHAGGVGSIRGFEFRGVGPRAGLNDDPIGGDFLLTASVEYSFPLVGELLRGVVFTDMGTVEEDFALTTWRASIGVGVRLTLDGLGGIALGPLPIEIDFAIPISSGKDDEEQSFGFFIGGTF